MFGFQIFYNFFGHHFFLHFGASFLLGLLSLVCPLMNIYLLVVNSFLKSEIIFSVLTLFIWKYFCLLSSLKCFHWIWSWWQFSLNLLKIHSNVFWFLLFTIEKSAVGQNVISLKINLSFLLLNFKISSFSDIRNFHYKVT